MPRRSVTRGHRDARRTSRVTTSPAHAQTLCAVSTRAAVPTHSHTAMIAYLEAQPDDRYANTCAAFRREAAAADALPTDAAAVRPDLLERKWTSVVRLTRKVLDLETRLAQMATDLEEARKSSGGYGGGGHAGEVCMCRLAVTGSASCHRRAARMRAPLTLGRLRSDARRISCEPPHAAITVDPEFLPRKPASSVLEGHRGPVTVRAQAAVICDRDVMDCAHRSLPRPPLPPALPCLWGHPVPLDRPWLCTLSTTS